METYDQILATILDAIEEYNQADPEAALARSPATVLVGDGGQLTSSLGIVTLAALVEEGLQRTIHHEVSLLDVFVSAGSQPLDVQGLARHIATTIGST